MDKYVIGVDPDSAGVPMARYLNGKLMNLATVPLIDFYKLLLEIQEAGDHVEIHIENVCASNAVFSDKETDNKRKRSAIGVSIGRCQQAQIEVERMAEGIGVPVYRHKQSSAWKDGRGATALFKAATGWTGRSNPDTRSAAYFGKLGTMSPKYNG
ncbi:hypothetical protein JCM19235_1972 [Vibrio maritimus]|uniref:Uncharacterized protein n=1 Tax=Vibrio maritimus TaxID=990268 RepID=A0A090RWH7_9VIBR|nr:hypothetical protein JCM19235_1972 [Vibrio maritimus]